ncbi:hydrogenase/urease accessory protein HupE [Marinobacter pelagius]|uniref:Hydrogenase/urease accessory protein HupE n=1 Tax=Marinobacter pelagius TaxID=379482 RepID=A0A366GVY5_9GAMM|nr:HupE/UreJ family protein [Marinobacter pelagius]RBP32376.1 hydrogenase/urease accessory protein HupE [Marinobacter pelagius]
MTGLRLWAPWLLLLAFLSQSGTALAHKASDSFIYLDSDAGELRIDVALRDLALLVPLDQNQDRQITGREVRNQRPIITRTVENGLELSAESGVCRLQGLEWGLSRHSDGRYAAARYRIVCPDGDDPGQLQYSLLFDRDSLHRGLVRITSDSGSTLAVLSPDRNTLPLTSGSSRTLETFAAFLVEGVVHLLIGLDHILFLLVLVLPVSLMAPETGSDTIRSSIVRLAGIVTAFTVAHSITLALAALNLVTLPIAWVETVIALSIAVAAVNVIWPVLGRKTWKLAFAFGLIHGFGFASVLGDLTSGVSDMAVALAGFNLGVELGQLGLLVLGFPVLCLFSRWRLYQRAIVPAILLAVVGTSLVWAAERAAFI